MPDLPPNFEQAATGYDNTGNTMAYFRSGSFPLAMKAGGLVTVGVSYTDASNTIHVANVTDDAGNDYVFVAREWNATEAYAFEIWAAAPSKSYNAAVGNRITAHYSALISFPRVLAHEYSSSVGRKRWRTLPVGATSTGFGTSAGPIQLGTALLPVKDRALIFAMGGTNGGNVTGVANRPAPVLQGSATTGEVSSGTSLSVNVPAGVQAGETLVNFMANSLGGPAGQAFNASATVGMTAAATSQVVNISGATTGAWCYLWVALSGTPGTIAATGWTSLGSATSANGADFYAVLRRQKQAGDTTFTVTFPTAKGTLSWVAYTGLDGTVPDTGFAITTNNTTSRTTVPTPTATPPATGEWGVAFFAARTTNSLNKPITWTPSGITERTDADNNTAASSPWIGVSICDTASNASLTPQTYQSAHNVAESNDASAILFLVAAAVPAPAVPDGWTRKTIAGRVGTTLEIHVDYHKVVDPAAEPASYTWTNLVSGRHTAFMVRVSGADMTSNGNQIEFFDNTPTTGQNTGVGSSLSIADLATLTDKDLVLSLAAGNAAAGLTWTPPAGFTSVASSTGTGRGASLARISSFNIGNTGVHSWSWSQTNLEMLGITIAIRPAIVDMAMRTGGRVSTMSADYIQATAASTLMPVTPTASGNWGMVAAIFYDSDDSLTVALDSPAPAWVGPRVGTDWLRQVDGTWAGQQVAGIADGFDDLSGQSGDSYTVDQSYDDGLPDPVTATTGANASGTLELPQMTGRRGLVFDHLRQSTGVFDWDGTATKTSIKRLTVGEEPAAATYLVWMSWRSANLLTWPAGFSVVVPQTLYDATNTAYFAVFKVDHTEHYLNPSEVLSEAWTFDGPAAYEIFSTICQYVDSSGRWMAGEFQLQGVVIGGAPGTTHTSPAITVPGDVSGAVPFSILFIDQLPANGAGSSLAQLSPTLSPVGNIFSIAQAKSTFGTNVTKSVPGTYTTQATTGVATSNRAYVIGIFKPYEFDQEDARQYFSEFNPNSPINQYDRDLSPVTLDHGILTDDGPQYLRVFTGQMADIAVKGRQGDLTAVSKSRLDMMKSVLPPLVHGATQGANLTWLVTWLLGECAKYAGPPPSAYARAWITGHGSMVPNMADPINTQATVIMSSTKSDQTGIVTDRPTTVDGPFVLGLDAWQEEQSCRELHWVFRPVDGWPPNYPNRFQNLYTNVGYWDLLTRTNNIGRFSCWVRGDAVFASPSLYSIPSGMTQLLEWNLTDLNCNVWAGIDSNRKLYVRIRDASAHDTTFTSATVAVPNDGQWHHCAWSYDFDAGLGRVYVDGLEDTSTAMTTTDNDLSSGHDVAGMRVFLTTRLPIAEMLVEAVDSWADLVYQDQITTQPTAIVQPVDFDLEAIVETAPQTAWDLMVSLATACLATYRCDEQDRVWWLPLSYFGKDAQMQVMSALDTATNAQDIDANRDPSRIRNSCTVVFNDTSVSSQPLPVLEYSTAMTIPTGTTVMVFPLDTQQAEGVTGVLYNLTAAEVTAGHPATPSGSWATVNTKADGSGTYLTNFQVSIFVTDFDSSSVTVQFDNYSGKVAYLVNAGDTVPMMVIYGYAVTQSSGYVTKSDPASIAKRGERSLTSELPYIHNRIHASQVASWLVAMLCQPTAEATVTVMGDPTRTPGQIVSLTDSQGTGATGRWRITGIKHTRAGAQYTQDLALIQQGEPLLWGTGLWGRGVWSE